MRSNMRGGVFYNPEPRNFNRGSGRGSFKMHQSSHPPPSPSASPQPPRRGDLFIEAGRLAVEYLVSHGLLSSNVLPGKCQNGNLRSNKGEPQDHLSSQDRELNSVEARSSASARPRAVSPEGVSIGRRSPSDQDLSRKSSRERRNYGASRSYSSDWNRENGREVSPVEKVIPSLAMEADYEKNPKVSAKDVESDVCVAHSSELVNDGSHRDLHPESGVDCSVDSCSKIASSLPSMDVGELPKSDGEVTKETKDDHGNEDKEHEIQKDESHIQQSEKTNDSLTQDKLDATQVKTLNSEPVFSTIEKPSEIGHDHSDPVEDDSMSGFSGNLYSNEIPTSNGLDNAYVDHSFSGAVALASLYNDNPIKYGEFLSGVEKTSPHEQRSSGLPELQMCCSDPKVRGVKRAPAEDCETDGLKKAKQWLSVAQSNEYLKLAKSVDKKPNSPLEMDATTFSESPNQAGLPCVSLPQNVGVEPGINEGEEMQLFSSSYKTCDLNLMEASDMPENHRAAALLYPSGSAPKKEASLDIDLSMSNNFNFTNAYTNVVSGRKDVEIIDLEGSSLEEGQSLISTRNAEADIASMESFANNPQNPSDNAEGQDGYGFMISELLGNDVPNCSSAQPDVNSLHNDMGLHHGEVIFNEDDPIYMSLGEIPLTGLLQGWEQPTQERNPFEL